MKQHDGGRGTQALSCYKHGKLQIIRDLEVFIITELQRKGSPQVLSIKQAVSVLQGGWTERSALVARN